MINLLAMLIAAFNKLVWPDDEDKLPPDIQSKPHITLGHDFDGHVLYFDRVGAMLDNLEWFGQENSPFIPFVKDVKEILDGRMTFTNFVLKMFTSPINKVVSGINPLIKTPFELLTSRSLYPDFTHPRNINSVWQYLAQAAGMRWPFDNIAGLPVDNWKEFKNLFVYQEDAEEAAYFYIKDLVRQYQENVLGKYSSHFTVEEKNTALKHMKAALRLGQIDTAMRYIDKYYSLGGTEKGLKTSKSNMHPLNGLSNDERKKFEQWISEDDRKYLHRALAFYDRITKPLPITTTPKKKK